MSDLVIADKSELVSIADAVRSLMGTTNTMNLNEMKSNLNTTKTSIDNAFNALNEKGVTVPDGSVADALSGLIEAIEAGDGGVSYPWLLMGTVTPADSVSDISIDLTQYGYDLSKKTYPYTAFFFEIGYGRQDTSHTVKRPYAAILAVDADTGNGGTGTGLGSNAGAAAVTGNTRVTRGSNSMLGASFVSSAPGGCITGNITTKSAVLNLKASNDGTEYALIPGRTYLWGVIY